MAVFAYRGQNKDQATVRGTILADSARHARDQLRQQGLIVHTVREQTSTVWQLNDWLSSTGSRRARQQWSFVAHELSMLLTAGIPLSSALDDLATQYRGKMQSSLMKLRDQIESGTSLASAMEMQPEIFDAASIRLVEVGENAGTLEVVLAEIADFRLQLAEFKDKITTALLYPAFLLIFGLAAMIFLMTWVMPPLLESLEETLKELPWPTLVTKRASQILIEYRWWLLAGVVGFTVAGTLWFRSPNGRRKVDQLLVRLPFLGPLFVKQALARAATIVALLTKGGVMLTTALHLAAKSTSNSVIRQALYRAEEDIIAGEDVADSLSKNPCIPRLAVRFFAVGQDSGKLDEMLQKLASDYNKQISTAAARITAFVEPCLILILAVAVGFLLLATILPILEAGNVAR